MRVAEGWTKTMALGIVVFGAVSFTTLFDWGVMAWICAIPALFFGLQAVGLPIVLLCELGEKLGLLRRHWRPVVDEFFVVLVMVLVSTRWLVPWMVNVFAVFFLSMYGLRWVLRKHWVAGEPEEVQG